MKQTGITQQQRQAEKRLRDKAFPVKYAGRQYASGASRTRDDKIYERFLEIRDLYVIWCGAFKRAFDNESYFEPLPWKAFLSIGDEIEYFVENPYSLWMLLRFDDGVPYDVPSIHRSHKLWYHGKPEYRLDITMLLVKLINNFWWAKARGSKHFIRASPWGFPVMNYVFEDGPWLPPLMEQHGPEDQQLILHDGEELLMFPWGVSQFQYAEVLRVRWSKKHGV